jgi:hypothetical protein
MNRYAPNRCYVLPRENSTILSPAGCNAVKTIKLWQKVAYSGSSVLTAANVGSGFDRVAGHGYFDSVTGEMAYFVANTELPRPSGGSASVIGVGRADRVDLALAAGIGEVSYAESSGTSLVRSPLFVSTAMIDAMHETGWTDDDIAQINIPRVGDGSVASDPIDVSGDDADDVSDSGATVEVKYTAPTATKKRKPYIDMSSEDTGGVAISPDRWNVRKLTASDRSKRMNGFPSTTSLMF